MLSLETIEKMPVVTVLTDKGAISTGRLSNISFVPVVYRHDGSVRKDVKKVLRDKGATYRLAIRAGARVAMKNFN